jgi:hypothetical protein
MLGMNNSGYLGAKRSRVGSSWAESTGKTESAKATNSMAFDGLGAISHGSLWQLCKTARLPKRSSIFEVILSIAVPKVLRFV